MTARSLVGSTGTVIVATRGEQGLGEVSLSVGGGTESYLAWSPDPLPRGTAVVVTDSRGPRTVEVEPLEEFGLPSVDPAAVPPDPTLGRRPDAPPDPLQL